MIYTYKVAEALPQSYVMTAIRIIYTPWRRTRGSIQYFQGAIFRLNGSDLCALLVWRCGRNDIRAIVVRPHAPCIVGDVTIGRRLPSHFRYVTSPTFNF